MKFLISRCCEWESIPISPTQVHPSPKSPAPPSMVESTASGFFQKPTKLRLPFPKRKLISLKKSKGPKPSRFIDGISKRNHPSRWHFCADGDSPDPQVSPDTYGASAGMPKMSPWGDRTYRKVRLENPWILTHTHYNWVVNTSYITETTRRFFPLLTCQDVKKNKIWRDVW